jgi:hypothetical protein
VLLDCPQVTLFWPGKPAPCTTLFLVYFFNNEHISLQIFKSLPWYGVNYYLEKFYSTGPRCQCDKRILLNHLSLGENKLECFYLESFSRPSKSDG